MANTIPQYYPRIENEESKFYGYLDENELIDHRNKILVPKLKEFIASAIDNASKKSSRVILNISNNTSNEELDKIFIKKGKELFKYFKKYCGDPAATAHQINKKHFEDICKDQFRIRTLQKERMNSGWRYQFLAIDCAHESKRFKSVSDIGAVEADFNATIECKDGSRPLSLYVSIKNRMNTIGGQDWPKAIHALETVAKMDKNRTGPYCCVFGIAMDRGQRIIKKDQKTNNPHSINTEVWLSDFFWPFFSNFTYEEIMNAVLSVLLERDDEISNFSIHIPKLLIKTFGECCREHNLIDEQGIFNDPYKLVDFFCK